jgi:RNA polymerase sigma-70 factor (ECF subfamily)
VSPNPDFEAWVDAHSAELYAYLRRLLRDPHDAEDCLQEAFLRALAASDRLPAEANVRAWLYRIATNTAFSLLRARYRRDGRASEWSEDVHDGGPSPEALVDQQDRLQAVRRAVEALPPRQRSALILRKYQALSYEQIGEALACSPQTARAHVYQALKKLRVQFAASPEEEKSR